MIEVEHLTKRYGSHTAVDDISFTVEDGGIYGLLGPNGAGKSTTMNIITGYISATDGTVKIDGHDIADEPAAAKACIGYLPELPPLYPEMTTREYLLFVAELKGTRKKADRIAAVEHAAARAGLQGMEQRLIRNLSKGYRQRVGIARAFALKPKLIICDEPVSALDVSIQAQVLNLLKELQDKFGTAYLFIAHDLSVVQHISDRVAVMYLGKMVEVSDWKTLYSEPHHPYTQSLLSAVPVPDPDIQKTRKRIILAGDPPSPLDPPTGCRFHTRCPIAQGICSEKLPEFKEVAPGHCCACHFAEPFPIKESHIDL